MANYATLKAAIQQVVKTNGNNEITGALLQQSLLAMINSLGGYYQFAGIATPSTNPGTPDQNVFYLASTAGTYSNFGGLVLANGEIAILKYDGAWHKDSTGAASLAKVDGLPIPNIGMVVNLVPFADGLTIGGLNDTTGAETTNNARLRTGYIPVADTKFFKARTGNWDCEVLCYKYENGSYSYLGYTHYLVDGTQEYKAGTTHIRLYIMNSQDSSPKPSYDVSAKLFVADENGMLVVRKDISALIASEHTKWIVPSLDIARGHTTGTFYNWPERTDTFVVRIPITGGQTIRVRTYVATDGTSRRALAFRADGVRLDYYNGQATERSINVPANTAYMDFAMDLAHINDVYVKDSNGNYLFKYSPYGEIQTRHNQTKIRVGQWNVGAWDSEYYYEGGTTRKETHTTDELIALLRGIFTEMQADIVILNEYEDFLDSAKTASVYEQVLKQFYPYIKTYETITTAPKLAVASRFPIILSNEYVDNSVRALVGNIDIGFHNRIGFIATHLSANDAATRITQAGLIASLVPGFKYGICGGDMNTGNNGEDSASISAQMTPFINAGYTPANRGYWGAKVTYYQPQVALDNIYARGINVVNYKVLESRPGSDHFPTYADITLWE